MVSLVALARIWLRAEILSTAGVMSWRVEASDDDILSDPWTSVEIPTYIPAYLPESLCWQTEPFSKQVLHVSVLPQQSGNPVWANATIQISF